MTSETDRHSRLPLGKTGLLVSPMGLGAWAWGDRFYWSYGKTYGQPDIEQAFEVSVAGGVDFIDTAEIYGFGRSEKLLSALLHRAPETRVVTSKFFPFPWRLGPKSLRRALKGSLHRLGLKQLDLYLIHWPNPPVSIETWMDALATCVAEGLTRSVGVSNYSIEQMQRAADRLDRHGLVLACNQVHFSLLHPEPMQDGLLEACSRLDISPVAYSPLAQGLLTGKYLPDSPPSGLRRRRYSRGMLERAASLVEKMKDIGAAHDGKSPAQVALNWVISKGAIPIPGAKNGRQAGENLGALGWRLTPQEVETLDRAALSSAAS